MKTVYDEQSRTAVFGGGCFWCTEAVFRMLKGVSNVEPGYAGGSIESPSYERVSEGNTGHAQVIRITYDPTVISYEDLLTVFFGSHDPTTPNRQGTDTGEQYRSVILYSSEDEKTVAEKMIQEMDDSLKDLPAPRDASRQAGGTRVVTQIVPLGKFFAAEEYHQKYFEKNTSAPYCQLIIKPKVEKVRMRFAELLNQ